MSDCVVTMTTTEDLIRRFSEATSLTETSVKWQNPSFGPSQPQPQQQQQQQQPSSSSSSPFVCMLCRSRFTTGTYLGEDRWSVTCGRCRESFIVKQGGS